MPATVRRSPSEPTFATVLLPLTKKTFPDESTANAYGEIGRAGFTPPDGNGTTRSRTLVDGVPVPAYVEMIPAGVMRRILDMAWSETYRFPLPSKPMP